MQTAFYTKGNVNGILLETVNCILVKDNANHILLERGDVSCILLKWQCKCFFVQQKDVCVGVSLYLCKSDGYVSRQPMH